MLLRRLVERNRARLALRAAHKSLSVGRTALAAAQFSEAAARSCDHEAILAIHRTAGSALLDAGAARDAMAHALSLAEFTPDDMTAVDLFLRTAEAAGDAGAVEAALRMRLSREPNCVKTHRRLVEVLHATDARAALPHLVRVCDFDPADAKSRRRLARVRRALGDAVGEVAAWRHVLGLDDDDAEAHGRLAELLETRAPGEAIAHLQHLASAAPSDASLRRRLALARRALGDSAGEVAAWRHVLGLDDDDAEAHARLAELLEASAPGEAIAHLQHLASTAPSDACLRRRLARARRTLGDAAGEVVAWRHVLGLDHDDVEAHARLAELLEVSAPGEAIAHLQHLASAAPSDASLRRRLADARRATGDFDGEIEERLRLVTLDADDSIAHQRLAEIFLSQRDAKRAAIHLAASARGGLGGRSDWESLARLEMVVGDWAGAAAAWRRVASLGALDAEACMAAATSCLSARLPHEALRYANDAVALSPYDRGALRRLATICRAAARPDNEIAALERLLEFDPDDRRSLRRLGVLLYRQGQLALAAPYLKRAAEAAPARLSLARMLADAQRAVGDSVGEIEARKRILELACNDLVAHRRLGDLYYGLEHYSDAARHLEVCVESGEPDARLNLRLTKAYRRAGDSAGEVRSFRRQLVLTPSDAGLRLEFAELLQRLGEHREVIDCLAPHGGASPAPVRALRLLAASYGRLNDHDGELAALRGVAKSDPGDAAAHRRCAALLLERRQFAAAETHLRAILRTLPDDADSLASLAQCLRALDLRQDEIAVLKQLAGRAEFDMAMRSRLGELLAAEGAYAEALEQLRQCPNTRPEHADRQRLLAEAASAVSPGGEEAVAAWAKLVELAPDDAAAMRRLADAYFKSGRYEEAAPIYDALTNIGHGDLKFWENRVRIARALHGAEGEAPALRAAIDANPGAAEFRYSLCERLIKSGAADAVETLRAAWKIEPDARRFAELCRKLIERHRVDAAVAEYVFLLSEAPQSFAPWLGLGEIMMRMGRHRLAATYFGKAYELSGAKSHRKRWIASLLQAGAFETAESNCAALVVDAPADRNLSLQHALALSGLNRFDKARALLESLRLQESGYNNYGLWRYLNVRARAKGGVPSHDDNRNSPEDQMLRQAEARQAAGDLRGAAQIYRAGGAALRRSFACATPDGDDVDGPDFLIIGAPRSGTSWLKHCLKHHPKLRVAGGEPAYFSSSPHFSPAAYAQRFAMIAPPQGAAAHLTGEPEMRHFGRPVFGEKTPEYLTMGDDAIELCASLYPNVRLVCMIREPVERAWSHLKHSRLAAQAAKFYQNADGSNPDWFLKIVEYGRYESHLRRWARRFPPAQFLLIDFARILTGPASVLKEVMDFVGVAPIGVDVAAMASKKQIGASAIVPPPHEVAGLLMKMYRNEIFDVATLRAVLGEAAARRAAEPKAA